MPGGDGTGPMGMGPMTGRAMGYCVGIEFPGYINTTPGRGFAGRGRGRGGGWRQRNLYYAAGFPGRQWAAYHGANAYPFASELAMSGEQELDALKDQAGYFENSLKEIKQRIEELETEKK